MRYIVLFSDLVVCFVVAWNFDPTNIQWNTCYDEIPGFQYVGESLETCVRACAIKDNCAGLEFNRLGTLCRLYDASERFRSCPGIIVIKKIHFSNTALDCSRVQCLAGSRCDEETKTCVASIQERTVGRMCQNNTDCMDEHVRCIDGRCYCIPLHEYHYGWKICQAVCSSYSSTQYIVMANTWMVELNIPIAERITGLENCKAKCSQLGNACAGFDYYYDICYFAPLTLQQAKDGSNSVRYHKVNIFYSKECISLH